MSSEGSAGERVLAVDRLRGVLAAATFLPRSWVLGMVLVAVASTVDVTFPESGGVRWQFTLGGLSLAAVALIWLPTALRLISMTGGSIKAAGVEASATGIVRPDQLVDDLASLRTSAERVARELPATEPGVRTLEAEVDSIAQRYLPREETLSPEIVDGLAREYERIRRDMPPGQARTIAMNKLLNQVRVRATAAPESARRLAPGLLRSSGQGDRIVGLALVQGSPTADAYEDLLRILSTAASAFEQYHSVLALKEIAPLLGPAQRERAIAVLEREKTDPRGVGVMKDRYIPAAIDHVLSVLRAGAA